MSEACVEDKEHGEGIYLIYSIPRVIPSAGYLLVLLNMVKLVTLRG